MNKKGRQMREKCDHSVPSDHEKEAAYLLEQIKAKVELEDQGTNRRKKPGLWKRLKNKYNAFFDNMHTGIIVDD